MKYNFINGVIHENFWRLEISVNKVILLMHFECCGKLSQLKENWQVTVANVPLPILARVRIKMKFQSEYCIKYDSYLSEY